MSLVRSANAAPFQNASRPSDHSLGRQLAKDILQDAAVLEVLDLLGGVDADFGFEFFYIAFGCCGFDLEDAAVGELAFEQRGEAGEIVDFFASEAEGLDVLAIGELKRQDAHADEVGAVNALEAFGDDGFN